MITERLFFLVPLGIHQVVFGDFLIDLFRLFGVHHFDEFGRCSAPKLTRFDDCLAQHNRSGGNDGSFAYDSMVENYRAHAYEGSVVYGSSVYGNVVSDGYVIADFDGGFFV